MKSAFIYLSPLLFIIACTVDKTAAPVPSEPIKDTIISFNADIVPILETYCYGTGGQRCHVPNSNQNSNGDFTTCAGLVDKVNNGSLEARVFTPSGGMPPSFSNGPQQLADSDMQKLQLWVAQGANCN